MQINVLVFVLIILAAILIGFGASFAVGPKGAQFKAGVGTQNGNGNGNGNGTTNGTDTTNTGG